MKPLVNTQCCTGNHSSGQITKTSNITPKTVIEYSSQTGNQIKPTTIDLEDSKPVDQLKNIQITSISQKFPIEDVNKNITNVEDLNKTKKASWASNYLQSIGHNNIKPIKINLSRSKIQKIVTVPTKSNESSVPRITLLKESSSCSEDYHMTENSVTAYPNEKIGEHIEPRNIKALHPNNLKPDANFTRAPVVPSIDFTTSANSNIVLDTIYTKNNNNTIASAYATLLAKGNGEATYCYNDGKCEIDILDAIKSKINRESANERSTRTMNLPTHKDMCEEFIKEISNKSSTLERKRDHIKSTMKSKKDVSFKKCSTSKLDAKVKKIVKTDKKVIKESFKNIKKKTADKEKVKSKSEEINKKEIRAVKERKTLEQDKAEHKKKQNNKSIIDLKDFDILTKQNVHKDSEMKQKNDNHGSDRQKLKRVRTISEELHNSSSENCAHSPVRSVVVKTEKRQSNSPKRRCLEIVEGFDLRSKLSRANQRIHRKQMENDLNTKEKQRENLKITLENQNNEKSKSPKKSNVLKYKTKKRKLKLIINVVCQESDDETSSSDSNISETSPTQNMDLSFLDDFNVDEIVDSLKHSPKHKMKSPLPHDSKLEGSTEVLAEPQLNLATILNMLQAKSDNKTNKLRNSVKAECNIEETVTSNSSSTSNQVNLNPMSDVKMEEDKTSIIKKEVNNINYDENKNSTHALIQILSQTKSQIDQQKTASPADDSLDKKFSSEEIDSKIDVININENKQLSEDTDMLVIDESVIITERDISLIDLTDETLLPTSSEECEDSIKAISNYIQSGMQNVNVNNSKNTEKDGTENLPNLRPDNNLEVTPSKHLNNKNPSNENRNNTADSTYIDVVETNTLNKNHEIIIDLTDETVNDIHEVERNNAITQKQVENEAIFKQEQHLILLPNIETQIAGGNKLENDKIISKNKKPTEYVKNIKPTNNGLGDTNIKTNAQVKNNNDTVKVSKEADTKNLENMKNIPETNKVSNMPAKEIINMTKVLETKAAAKIIKNIVDSVWDTKNELGNTFKTNQNQNKIEKTSDVTKTELENVSKSNNTIDEKKAMPETILFGHKTNAQVKNNNDTVKVSKEADTKNIENMKNIPETNKVSNMPAKEIINMTKVLETKAAAKIIKNIVDSVWDTKNELENTSKTNQNQNKSEKTSDEAKTELENVSKSNNTIVEKKTVPETILFGQQKALAMLLEERMLNYLHKEVKVIKHISSGKYSNIFSCRDSTTGEIYAAKILKNQNNRHTLGIQKEQMIRQLQQDIPRENLNTVYLIDGFGVERYWCFLTDYYPKNLRQVLQEQKKPFHIDLVQDLTRQLMSAVMVLRNNEIVHSDITPRHILMNSTYDRLKLCGFDEAYYGNDVYPLPNIGTSSYRAPEVILGFSASYSIDVWSSALVIYQMATGQRLFNGVFNNDVLYKQMCTFGSLPRDMVQASLYMNRHFQGNTFMRRVGFKGQDAILFQKFYKTKRLHSSLIAAYNKHWMTKNAYQRNSDMFKLAALYRLLEQMLLLDPRLRLAIEFVCADPFIYEMFS